MNTDKPSPTDKIVGSNDGLGVTTQEEHMFETKSLEETTALLVALRKAVEPFYAVAVGNAGRIPTERLSAADWHNLWKAYELPPPRGAVTPNAESSGAPKR